VTKPTPPRPREASTRRHGAGRTTAGAQGTSKPTVSAALAALATEDELGKWLAGRWGSLADADPELLDQIDL
jgi:hypothetical protein